MNPSNEQIPFTVLTQLLYIMFLTDLKWWVPTSNFACLWMLHYFGSPAFTFNGKALVPSQANQPYTESNVITVLVTVTIGALHFSKTLIFKEALESELVHLYK